MDLNIHHGLIIAAGRGLRFGATTDSRPKPLIEVAGVPLLCRTLLTAQEAGIDDFIIVTGYRGEILEEFLQRKKPWGINVRCLQNKEWDRPNGLSVLRAKGHLRIPFVLLMADHLFEAQILKKILSPLLPPGHCRLAVDFHPERIFDLGDATKVAVQDGRVKDIGKEIKNYNAVDTGIFFCSPGIFDALETAISQGKESLSDGIRELANRDRMEAIDIGDLFWQDVDDEISRLEVERRLLRAKSIGLPETAE